MKHYLFHLISAVLLVILFLVALDLARDKQIMQKQIDGLTEKIAAAEQLLEKEREENAAKTAETEKKAADDAAEVAAKTARIEAENKDLQEKLAILEESVAEMGRRFQVVSARDVILFASTGSSTLMF